MLSYNHLRQVFFMQKPFQTEMQPLDLFESAVQSRQYLMQPADNILTGGHSITRIVVLCCDTRLHGLDRPCGWTGPGFLLSQILPVALQVGWCRPSSGIVKFFKQLSKYPNIVKFFKNCHIFQKLSYISNNCQNIQTQSNFQKIVKFLKGCQVF